MPSQKRQRHREARAERVAAEAAATRSARQRRSGITVALAALAVVGLVFLVTRGGDEEVATGSSTTVAEEATTTVAEEATTTVPGESTTTAPFVPPPGCPPAAGTTERKVAFDAAPPRCLNPSASYSAQVETTKGDFTIEFDSERAPNTVNNFVFLARNRYYEGIKFHRVIPGFVIQGGDPQGNGSGGPGYRFADELPREGEYELGSLAMANSGPDTNGSQFFVITGPQGEGLPAKYSLFGQVTEGLDVVKAIEAGGSASGTPTDLVTIEKVTITES
ncbi:MAG: peptidylprolyl isomerase [Acidimicrobiales bacterium]